MVLLFSVLLFLLSLVKIACAAKWASKCFVGFHGAVPNEAFAKMLHEKFGIIANADMKEKECSGTTDYLKPPFNRYIAIETAACKELVCKKDPKDAKLLFVFNICNQADLAGVCHGETLINYCNEANRLNNRCEETALFNLTNKIIIPENERPKPYAPTNEPISDAAQVNPFVPFDCSDITCAAVKLCAIRSLKSDRVYGKWSKQGKFDCP
ncbi:hypothetical protein niasHS_009404 [Heterodera schachtii]|uniref:Uncharacterized protein n=1 Tax=Heterodera schachtii TaxID=97005 RepID=A0ABD2JCC5_HETSC